MVTDFVVVLSRVCKIIRVVFNEHSEDGGEALGAKLIFLTKCITTMVCESHTWRVVAVAFHFHISGIVSFW